MTLDRNQFLQLASGALLSAGMGATAKAAEQSIVGSWKLVSLVTKDLGTEQTDKPLGNSPKGYLIYTPEGRMMALLVHENRSPPIIDTDRINLHKYMVAYSGRYEVNGSKIVHHVDISWNESWTGTDQVRFARLEGDTLTIDAPMSSVDGAQSTSVLVWKRER